jgi:hypothetical protein
VRACVRAFSFPKNIFGNAYDVLNEVRDVRVLLCVAVLLFKYGCYGCYCVIVHIAWMLMSRMCFT